MSDPAELAEEYTPPPVNAAAGYERRIGKLTGNLLEQRQRANAAEERATLAEANAATLQGQVDTMTTEHTSALEAMTVGHATTLQTMERTSVLAASGVSPEGEGAEVILRAYDKLGADAPALAEWLKSETLPPHVTAYLGEQKPATPKAPNPDVGTGAHSGNNGAFDLTAITSIEQLQAAKKAGLI